MKRKRETVSEAIDKRWIKISNRLVSFSLARTRFVKNIIECNIFYCCSHSHFESFVRLCCEVTKLMLSNRDAHKSIYCSTKDDVFIGYGCANDDQQKWTEKTIVCVHLYHRKWRLDVLSYFVFGSQVENFMWENSTVSVFDQTVAIETTNAKIQWIINEASENTNAYCSSLRKRHDVRLLHRHSTLISGTSDTIASEIIVHFHLRRLFVCWRVSECIDDICMNKLLENSTMRRTNKREPKTDTHVAKCIHYQYSTCNDELLHNKKKWKAKKSKQFLRQKN